jgi:hypothetical protein
MRKFDESEYMQAREAYEGYCTECESWTRECTEPDAEGYDCPECEKNTVIGADIYLMG